jgi:uncharacterized protein
MPDRARARKRPADQKPAAPRAADGHAGRLHPAARASRGLLALRRALAKPHPRVIAVDDGAFRREQRWAPLVAVAVSLPGYVDGIARGRVRVDGDDATERIASLVDASGYLEGARALLLDGIAFGGFNLADLDELHRRLGVPVISATRRAPDLRAMRAAIYRYFPKDARRRWGLVTRHRLFPLAQESGRLMVASVGVPRVEVKALLRRATVRGAWPEPLRLAHLIARCLGRPPVTGPRANP